MAAAGIVLAAAGITLAAARIVEVVASSVAGWIPNSAVAVLAVVSKTV